MSDKNIFVRADARNLPAVDITMVLEYLMETPELNINEVRGWKAGHSMRSSYINSAVGWVQVKREGAVCIVKAKLCPEHKINAKLYDVESSVDEANEKLLYVKCFGCAASAGACKHATAFLMWLHEKSVSPSPTDVSCYWKKPPLARVNLKTVATLNDFKKITSEPIPESHTAVDLFISKLPLFSTVVCAQARKDIEFGSLCMHRSALQFLQQVDLRNRSYSSFLLYLCSTIQEDVCLAAAKRTVQQSKNVLWYSLRYGRITGSTLYELSRASENDSVIDKVMGASKVPLTDAITRGKELESDVFEEVCKKLNVKFTHTGFLVCHKMPHFGVSPDGISKEEILEIKCPYKDKSKLYYVRDNTILHKVRAQMQLQMYIFERKKGVLALADPNFEKNRKVELFFDSFDDDFFQEVCNNAENYWAEKIFPLLIK